MKRDVEITESVKKPLETYAATTLRISKTGRDEAKDLKTFRDAYGVYVAATDVSINLLKQAWNAQTKQEMEALRAKARANTTQNAGLKMEATILALNELLTTVKEVGKDKNDEGRLAAANALVTLVVGTAIAIAVGCSWGG